MALAVAHARSATAHNVTSALRGITGRPTAPATDRDEQADVKLATPLSVTAGLGATDLRDHLCGWAHHRPAGEMMVASQD